MACFALRRPHARSLAAAVAFSILGAGAKTALANDIEYCSFASVAGLQLNGNAAQAGSTLRLSRNVANQDSSAFRTPTLALTAAADFHTHFQFVLVPGRNGQADGVTFVVQSDARGAGALGGNGGGIGYGMSNGGTPIQPAVEVEFDAFQNQWDPNDNHVGVMRNGDETTHVAVGTPAFNLAGGAPVDAWIDYAAATTTLSVFVSNTGTKPATALVTATVDVFSIVGAAAYFGFTGSTGGESEQQVIDMWILNRGGLSECTCTADVQCAAPTPHCAPSGDPSAGACVACLADAQCDGSPDTKTPICDKSGGALTDTCRACGANPECAATSLEPVCVPGGNHAGQCAACASNTDCPPATPVCLDTGATNRCVQCATRADCSGTTPVCDATTHACRPCAGDSDCDAPTPACQTSGPLQGECTQCSATNTSACAGASPLCNPASGTCVACDTNSDCAGTTPLCAAHTCVGCTSDYAMANPPPGSCPTAQLPACQTSGALAGECTQCSPSNASACPPGETCVGGMCTAAGPEGGTDGGEAGASGSGGFDAGGDGASASGSGGGSGGTSDSGSDGSSDSSGSGNSSGGEADSGSETDDGGSSGAPTQAGANADAPVSLEGGGCAAGGDGGTSLVTWGALGMLFAGAGAARRRRPRRER